MNKIEKDVLEAIRLITASKIMNRQEPHHALLSEIADHIGKSQTFIREVCGSLYRRGLITGGKTINDSWFMTVPTPEEIEQQNKSV